MTPNELKLFGMLLYELDSSEERPHDRPWSLNDMINWIASKSGIQPTEKERRKILREYNVD